jgi:hypothetical protein
MSELGSPQMLAEFSHLPEGRCELTLAAPLDPAFQSAVSRKIIRAQYLEIPQPLNPLEHWRAIELDRNPRHCAD